MKSLLKQCFRAALIVVALAMTVAGWAEPGMLLFAAPPVVLDTQKMVWLTSIREEYSGIDTWLSEAEDLSSFVRDGQTLVFPEAGGSPVVYENKTTDVDSIEPAETTHEVSLNLYDTQNYKIRNIYLHALPFNKVQYYTQKSAEAIVRREIENAAHRFCPDSAGGKRIVVPSTGPVRDGYRALALDDIITLVRQLDNASFPTQGRNLVLSSEMWWDLVSNNAILKGQLERMPMTGIILPKVVEYYGLKIHKSEQTLNIGYDVAAAEKAPQGTIIDGDVVPAGFGFVRSSVFRAGGEFKMFKKDMSQNTEGRAEEFGFSHRFVADFQMSSQRYSFMIYLAKGA